MSPDSRSPNSSGAPSLMDTLQGLVVPGSGGRRIFRLLLPDTCSHACDFCPARAQRALPEGVRQPARLARLFLAAYRRGWCDGLFVMCGVPRDPVRAMDRAIEIVSLLRFTLGYRGYIHVKGLGGAQPGQIERLLRLVDRVSYALEPACRERVDGPLAAAAPAPAPPVAVRRAAHASARAPRTRRLAPAVLAPRLSASGVAAPNVRLLPPARFYRRPVQPALFELSPGRSGSSAGADLEEAVR